MMKKIDQLRWKFFDEKRAQVSWKIMKKKVQVQVRLKIIEERTMFNMKINKFAYILAILLV